MATQELVVPRSIPMTGPETLEELKRACMAGDCGIQYSDGQLAALDENTEWLIAELLHVAERGIASSRRSGEGMRQGRIEGGRESRTYSEGRPASREERRRAGSAHRSSTSSGEHLEGEEEGEVRERREPKPRRRSKISKFARPAVEELGGTRLYTSSPLRHTRRFLQRRYS